MDLLDIKIVCGFIIFLVTLLGGVGPFLFFRRFTTTEVRHKNKAVSTINSTQAFACGIFIATCLLHLFPEAKEAIGNSLTSDLPVCEMIVAFGFLLLLVVENLILACHDGADEGNRQQSQSSERHSDRHSKRNSGRDSSIVIYKRQSSVTPNPDSERRLHARTPSVGPLSYGAMETTSNTPKSRCDLDEDSDITHNQADPSNDVKDDDPLVQDDSICITTNTRDIQRNDGDRDTESTQIKQEEITHGGADKDNEKKKKAVLKSFVLLFALSLHTVFDGLVVGIQVKRSELWTLLAAVTLHKALVSVSIALSLVESHHPHPRASVLYLSLFSLVAPVGLAVGVVITETRFNTHAQTLTSGILQSIATGTFMYVTFVESLEGRFDAGHRLLNVLLVLLGFGLVCGLRVVLPS